MTSQSPDAAGDAARIAPRLAGRMGIALPPSASVDYAEEIEGHDDAARLVLTMDEADWEAMKARPPLAGIDPATWLASQAFHLGQDEGAWTPRSAPGLIAAQTYLKNQGEALNVGVVPPSAGKVRVYLFWHQL